jgi:hypothetical protein
MVEAQRALTNGLAPRSAEPTSALNEISSCRTARVRRKTAGAAASNAHLSLDDPRQIAIKLTFAKVGSLFRSRASDQ